MCPRIGVSLNEGRRSPGLGGIHLSAHALRHRERVANRTTKRLRPPDDHPGGFQDSKVLPNLTLYSRIGPTDTSPTTQRHLPRERLT